MTSFSSFTDTGGPTPAYPSPAEIQQLMAQARALRAATIAWALRSVLRQIWLAWTAGIRDRGPSDALRSGAVATGGCA